MKIAKLYNEISKKIDALKSFQKILDRLNNEVKIAMDRAMKAMDELEEANKELRRRLDGLGLENNKRGVKAPL